MQHNPVATGCGSNCNARQSLFGNRRIAYAIGTEFLKQATRVANMLASTSSPIRMTFSSLHFFHQSLVDRLNKRIQHHASPFANISGLAVPVTGGVPASERYTFSDCLIGGCFDCSDIFGNTTFDQ